MENWWSGVVDGFNSKKGANALIGLGSGLLSQPTFAKGLAAGGQGFMQGAELDSQYAAEEAKLADRNVTMEWVKANYPQYANLPVEQAADLAFKMEAAKKSGGPSLTADMQNYQFAQENPGFAEFLGGNGEAPQIVETYDPQTGQPVKGYMQGNTFVPVGGPKMPSARDNPMNATIQKEIFEADEALQAGEATISGLSRALELNNQAYDGPGADMRSSATALFGDQSGIATQELKNVVTAQALESLKAVFGGMPTEGERKILLEIQGSVDQPKAVREAIYKRAMVAAERRVTANRAKAAGLRSGEYFDPSFSQQPAGNQTSTGLQWSIEP